MSFVVTPMETRLKSHFVYATVAVLAACQTPPASNQGTLPNKPAALIGQSASPSSQYEIDSFGPLQPPNFPGFHGGSNRGPWQAESSRSHVRPREIGRAHIWTPVTATTRMA